MKSIKIVTLAVPLIGGCELLNLASFPGTSHSPPAAPVSGPAPAVVAQPASPAASGAPIQLRGTPALAAEPQLEREEVSAETRFGDAEFKREQARALEGDADAAVRVARMYADGSNGVPRDERKMVLWLKHASVLDHAAASYQLYLYYLGRGLDRDAVRYERRAVRQGYTIPVRLDNRRG